MMELKPAAFWFVKLENASSLTLVQIKDVTDKTVELQMSPFTYHYCRYKIDDLEFVEEAKGWRT